VSCNSQAQKSACRAAGHGEAEPEGRRTNKGLEAGARRFQLADPCLEQQRLPFQPRPILQNAQGGREETTQTTRMSTGWGNHGRGIYTGRVCWGHRQCRVCTDASSALLDPEGVALYAAPLSKRPRILSSLNASHAKFLPGYLSFSHPHAALNRLFFSHPHPTRASHSHLSAHTRPTRRSSTDPSAHLDQRAAAAPHAPQQLATHCLQEHCAHACDGGGACVCARARVCVCVCVCVCGGGRVTLEWSCGSCAEVRSGSMTERRTRRKERTLDNVLCTLSLSLFIF
jgi:hypothetical protein